MARFVVSGCAVRRLAMAGLASAVLGCAADPERLIAEGRSEEAVEASVLRGSPNSRLLARYDLADAYFSQAQRALQAGDEERSAQWFSAARNQSLRILESFPTDAFAHNMLAGIAAYRRDLHGALQSVRIAREYDPRGRGTCLNLAELEVYGGELDQARQDLEAARKLRAAPAAVELVESLALWREGDLAAAREQFSSAARLDPRLVRMWNGATSIETFEDFTAHCCQSGGLCSLYMSDACAQIQGGS